METQLLFKKTNMDLTEIEKAEEWFNNSRHGKGKIAGFVPILMAEYAEYYHENKKSFEVSSLCEISKELHSRSAEKGFWDKELQVGTLLMLIVSELSEALEADRKNKHAALHSFYSRKNDRSCTEDFQADFQELIKDTFEDEIADTFIRLFDLCGALNIDIDTHINLKMKYNKTRPYKHNKEY